MHLLNIFLLLNLFIFVTSLSRYLNKSQFKVLNDIIITNNCKICKYKIEQILYKCFEGWAINQAYEFKKLHKHKCSNIFIDDLIISSKIGLLKSVKKYNGKSSFTNYAHIYVKSELLKTLTQHFSLSILPKSFRTKSKTNMTADDLILYKRFLTTQMIHNDDTWQIDKIYYTNNNINNINNNINNINNNNILHNINHNYELEETINTINTSLPPFLKRIFYLKYNIDFKPIRSNKCIAELMCCSEEYVRQQIIVISNILKNINLEN